MSDHIYVIPTFFFEVGTKTLEKLSKNHCVCQDSR